ncbi:hypothetical protein Leryth_024754 [Lithospermum erythrorhizon]|nr:hypothetical protein Leryth_024754 [Lithospermum erythrorhizon]
MRNKIQWWWHQINDFQLQSTQPPPNHYLRQQDYKINLPKNQYHRMPVILGNKESSDMWLNGLTPAMGKPSFDSPECINEVTLVKYLSP